MSEPARRVTIPPHRMHELFEQCGADFRAASDAPTDDLLVDGFRDGVLALGELAQVDARAARLWRWIVGELEPILAPRRDMQALEESEGPLCAFCAASFPSPDDDVCADCRSYLNGDPPEEDDA